MAALWVPAGTVLLFGLAVYGAGALCSFPPSRTRRSGLRPDLERWIWGLAVWTLGLFILACLDGFRPAVLLALAVTLAATGSVFLAVSCLRAVHGRPTLEQVVWTMVAGLPLLLVFAITVNPTVSWDAAVYHLTLPDLYLREGGFRVVPLLVYSVWPQAVELLFAVAMSLDGYVAAKALHFGFGLSIVAILFSHALPRAPVGALSPSRHGSATARVAGLVAVGLFLLNDVVLFEMRAAYVDLALAFLALVAFLLLERWLDGSAFAGPEDRRLLVAAGLACGLLASAKISGIVTAACLSTLLIPKLLRSNRRAAVRAVLAFGLPIAVLWLPWLLRSWIDTGNPVYPLSWSVFGGPDWSSRLGEQFLGWQGSIGRGRQPLDWLLLPWRVFTAGGQGYEHFDGRLTPLWLVFLPVALWRARRSLRTRRALLIATLLFATWALGSQQIRFLIPALPFLALATADGTVACLSARAIRRLARSPAAPSVLAWTAVALWLAIFSTAQTRLVAAGWSHLRLYSTPRFEMPEAAPRPPVFDAVARLPKGATVLLLNTNHLYHCRPTTCWADSFFEASQISDWMGRAATADEAAGLLRGRGVSHLAWSGEPRGVVYPATLLDLLQRPDLALPVFRRGPEQLWLLAPTDAGRMGTGSEAP